MTAGKFPVLYISKATYSLYYLYKQNIKLQCATNPPC